jgi:predicted kinase
MSRPALVIVCGAPGTGKTTLARHLGRALGVTTITKDDLKEALADRLGAGDRARSRELGSLAYDELYAKAAALLAAGDGVVLEANFHRAQSEPPLRALAAQGRAVVIECVCDAALRRQRFTERGERGERHAVHLDAEILANEWSDDASGFAIHIDCPRLVVDTTRGYEPPLGSIEAAVRGQ